jgi:hypothetical protein
MQIRLYRALPEHSGPSVQPPSSDELGNPTVTVVCLERNTDPDANNHTGYDYWGAYADNKEPLDVWEGANADTLVPINYTELPNLVTFYPSPFSGGTGATVLVRARDENGWFIADDPATPDVNEAWTGVVL